mmetsp:Transcript_1782/g.4897  ORF Transcript_1782/g.4897 Transcript_1782/m.4897 type:complete len:142 (-) Transcript_1782:54-479(-)
MALHHPLSPPHTLCAHIVRHFLEKPPSSVESDHACLPTLVADETHAGQHLDGQVDVKTRRAQASQKQDAPSTQIHGAPPLPPEHIREENQGTPCGKHDVAKPRHQPRQVAFLQVSARTKESTGEPVSYKRMRSINLCRNHK